MGLWARLRTRRATPTPAPAEQVLFSWAPGRQPWLPGGTYVGTSGWLGRVSRDEALTVPAVIRGRNLICSISALPLVTKDKGRRTVRPELFGTIDPNTPDVVTLAQTLDDLIFEGVSWWEILDRGPGRLPTSARHLDVEAVSSHPPAGGSAVQTLPSGLYPEGRVWVMGRETSAANVVRFDSPNPPLRTYGARAIRRAIKLAQAAEMYADDPDAKAYWRPVEDQDPGDQEAIEGFIRSYQQARRSGAEAYIPAAISREIPSSASPADLQLAQLQARSDLEIANLLGVDPEDLGVNTTSRTYNNAVDRRQDRLNTVLAPYMRAVTDRLSLDDITRPGRTVSFDLADYLKADPATRWANHAIAIDKEIMAVPEVREIEGLTDIPVEPRPAPVSRETVPVPRETSAPLQRNAAPLPVTFSAPDAQWSGLRFDQVDFAADTQARTVAGTLIPFGRIGENYRGKWRFAAGSVTWKQASPGRVKLNREHYFGKLLGSATEVAETATGIYAKFRIARTSDAEEALSLAADGHLDGLSAEVDILEFHQEQTADDGLVNVVTSARLKGAALTAGPAFDDARVTTVHASREGNPMNEPDPTPPAPAEPVQAFTAAVEAFTEAVEALGVVPPEQRPGMRPTAQVREPLVYSLNGLGPSFVKDAWDTHNAKYGSRVSDEALARLRKYTEQTQDLAQMAASQAFANAGNTTDQAEIIAPGYRPDLYVGQIPQGRPLFDAMGTRILLPNATSFQVPVWVSSADLSGTNVEGTGPSTGTITDHTYRTVTPTAQSGEFVVTRELMDSSNPAIDVIAMNAMREEYAQDTEAVIAAALAAATDNDTGAGQSTEGCYVYSVTGTGNDLAIDGVREISADFGGHRFAEPDTLLASPTGFKGLAKAIDDVGRPLFPFIGAQNAMGAYGRARRTMDVDGFAVPNVWSMTSTYDDLVMFLSPDLLVGESALLEFKFYEKGGPENIYLNIWGYFAFQILRYTGIHAVNYTPA